TWEIVKSLRQQGVTVLFTTHYMDEAEQLADRIAIIDHGRMAAMGDMESLRRGTETAVRVVAEAGLDVDQLRELRSAREVSVEQPDVYLFETEAVPSLLAELTAWARDRGVLIREIRAGRESLEEIFLRITGEEMRS
ncbi:MAG: ABC transporter ATP-binding protein, partial [Chloroflexota bacterium]|nr:ABC transporter ATP-binding protein [Chloroflexota bacterium]